MSTVIVGSGLAGITVAEGLRKADPNEAVALVTSETLGVYPRPLLSHGFTREAQRDRLVQKTFAALQQQGFDVMAGFEATGLDCLRRRLTLCPLAPLTGGDGAETGIAYTRLILAQGSAAFIPPPFRSLRDRFHTLNSLADLDRLTSLRKALRETGRTPEIAILGGGLIGCEVASDLATAGDKVTLVHGANRLLERVLDAEASGRLEAHLKGLGIQVILGARVDGIEGDAAGRFTWVQQGKPVTPAQDILLLATGFSPRIALAAKAGLAVNRGIVVNGRLQSSDESVYAVGDVAEVRLGEAEGKLYPFVAPIRHQALHLVSVLTGTTTADWTPPAFKAVLKVHGFKA